MNRRDLDSILQAVQDFEISRARAIELIDLAEAGKLRTEDFPSEPKNLFSEDDIPVDLYIEAKRKADICDRSEPVMLTQEAIDAIWEAQFEEYGQMCDSGDWNMFATSIEAASLRANGHEVKP